MAGAVVVGRVRVVVAGRGVRAAGHLVVVTDAVAIHVGCAGASTNAEGVELVSVTVAVAGRDVSTAAFVDGAGTVADSAGVHGAHTGVDVVADTVAVRIRGTGAATDADRVELVAIAVTVTGRDAGAAAFEDGARAIAHTTGVHGAHTGVDVVANAVVVGVGRAVSIADTNRVELTHAGIDIVTDAVAVGIRRAVSAADTEGVSLVAVAVTIAGGDVVAATFVDGAGSIADSALIQLSNARVDVVTDAVAIGVGRAVSITDTNRVQLTHTGVHIVADAVSVRIGGAVTATDAEGVCLVAVAVAIAGGDVGTAAFVDGARSVADAALIELTDTGVDVVTDAVAIRIRGTITATHAEGVELVAIAVTVAGRNVGATAFVDLAGSIAHAAGVVIKTGRRSRVAEVAGRQVGTGVHVVADAVSVAVLAVRNTEQVDVIEGDALVVGIGPHHNLKLQGRSIGNGHLIQIRRREVIDLVEEDRGLAIEDVLEADEVGILKGSHFGEGGADLELGVATHVDFPRGPDTIEVRVAALEDGVAGQHGLEPVRGATIDNAPLGFLSSCVGGAGPSVIEHGLIAEGLLPDDFGADALTAEVGQIAVGVDIAQCQGIAVITGVTDEDTGVVVVGGCGVVVARGHFLATRNFLRVADAVAVGVRRAVAVADAQGVVLSHAVVDIVTDTI